MGKSDYSDGSIWIEIDDEVVVRKCDLLLKILGYKGGGQREE